MAEPPKIDEESFYHYECSCGCNFPVSEFRVNDEEIICPACGKIYEHPKP